MLLDVRRVTQESRRVRFGAVAAVALAVAFVTWLLIRAGDDGASESAPLPTSSGNSFVAVATVQRLRVFARAVGHPVFWAGTREGVKYELTQTDDGRVYIRYLPRRVRVGDRTRGYLLVATYPVPNAFKAIQSAARDKGAHTLPLNRGGLAVYNDAAPTNVYFATPGSNYQVEVYHPNANRARTLVTGGQITPIR